MRSSIRDLLFSGQRRSPRTSTIGRKWTGHRAGVCGVGDQIRGGRRIPQLDTARTLARVHAGIAEAESSGRMKRERS